MGTYKKDEMGGFDFSSGNAAILTGNDAVSSDIASVAMEIKGENPYNIDQGVPYIIEILQTNDSDRFKRIMKRAIETRVPEAGLVLDFTAEFKNGSLIYSMISESLILENQLIDTKA